MKGEVTQTQEHKLICNINLAIFNQYNMFCKVNGFYKCSHEKSKCHITQYIYYYRVHTCCLHHIRTQVFAYLFISQTQKNILLQTSKHDIYLGDSYMSRERTHVTKK
jgi:hypothetical protein